jgi:hypothetical protein
MISVTAWYRLNEDGELKFNHIEYARLPRTATLPTPKCDVHKKTWVNGVWVPFNAKLTDDVPPILI